MGGRRISADTNLSEISPITEYTMWMLLKMPVAIMPLVLVSVSVLVVRNDDSRE